MNQKSLSLFLACTFLFSACAGRRPLPEEGSGAITGTAIHEPQVSSETMPGEQYGPQVPQAGEGASATPPVPAPAGATLNGPAKLCLVLGPGMAKAFAHAAVLEAIRRANIPVHCVVGTEMGAVVGALYSQAGGNTNSLQWQLFKLNKENYFNFPLISLRDPRSSGGKLHEFLRAAFRNANIESLSIPFATVATDLERDSTVVFRRGNLADALSATLAMPGIFDPWKVDGAPLSSGAVSSPAPLDVAASLGGNFMVLIDVLSDTGPAAVVKGSARLQKAFAPVRNLLRLQRREAQFVIQVAAGGVAYDDFSRQGEILAAGARAAERAVPELKAAWEKWLAAAQQN